MIYVSLYYPILIAVAIVKCLLCVLIDRSSYGITIDKHLWFSLQITPEECVFIHGSQGRILVYGRLELFPKPGTRFHISIKGFKFYWGQLRRLSDWRSSCYLGGWQFRYTEVRGR